MSGWLGEMENGINPVASKPQVIVNVFRDEDEITNRINNSRERTAYFNNADTSPESMSVYQNEIVFGVRGTRRRGNEWITCGLSTLNGAFKSGDKPYNIIEKIQFLGVAITKSVYDAYERHAEDNFVVQIGGNRTMKNTGCKRINNGDFIYWELPDPNNPFNATRRNDHTRILLWTTPYDPQLDRLTRDALTHYIHESVELDDNKKDYPIYQAARDLSEAMKEFFVLSVHILLITGIVDIDSFDDFIADRFDEMSENARKTHADPGKRQQLLINLSKKLGLLEPTSKQRQRYQLEFPGTDDITNIKTSLSDAVLNTFTASTKDYRVAQLQNKSVPPGELGNLYNNQTILVSKLFNALIQGENFKKKRIFGKALTSADPGQDFDIVIGSYCFS